LAKDELKKLSGCEYVIFTNNGTTATHLLAIALKYKHPNIRNLIVPSNVYVAAWNMFLVNPIYNLIPIDSDKDTWNFDEEALEKMYEKYSEDTAVLAVHNIGNIINVPELKRKYPNWVFIEDNCEGFLGEYEGKKTGSASLASSVSFFGNKTITSGEGGMFCTNDKDLFEYINRAKAHFITNDKFVFDDLGYNYRMTNVQAALLYGQITEDLDIILSQKKSIFEKYREALQMEQIEFQFIGANTKNSNWMFGIRIYDFISKQNVDKLKLYLYQNDIDTRPMFPPIYYHDHLKHLKNPLNKMGIFPASARLYEQCIILPSSPDLSESEISYITDKIRRFF